MKLRGGAPLEGPCPPSPPLALGAAGPLLVIKGRQGPGFGRRSRLDGGGEEGVVERDDPLRVPLPKLPVPVHSPVSQLGPRRLAELRRHRQLGQGPSGHPAAWEGSLDRAPLFPSVGAGAAPQGQARSEAPMRATPGCGAHRVSASEPPPPGPPALQLPGRSEAADGPLALNPESAGGDREGEKMGVGRGLRTEKVAWRTTVGK